AIVLIVMMLLTSSPKAIEIRGRIMESFKKKKKQTAEEEI
ncbi:MAG: branched-chain amino acid ABC transporter permease, partial [Clostridium sp.]